MVLSSLCLRHRKKGENKEMTSKLACTMRKFKKGNLSGIDNHNERKTDKHSNKDIDITKKDLNYSLVNFEGSYDKQIMGIINKQRTSTKAIRSDAVLVGEWIISSDQEFFKNLTEEQTANYFRQAFDYFSELFGEQNIAYATVHMDETTPHMHLGVVPMKDGCLTGKEVFNRFTLRRIQSEVPKLLQSQGFDIQRGEKGSKRKKLTVPEYKQAMEEMHEYEEKTSILANTSKELEEDIKTLEGEKEILNDTVEGLNEELEFKANIKPPTIKEKKKALSKKVIVDPKELQDLKDKVSTVDSLKFNNDKLKAELKANDATLARVLEAGRRRQIELDNLQWQYDRLEKKLSNVKKQFKMLIDYTKKFFKLSQKEIDFITELPKEKPIIQKEKEKKQEKKKEKDFSMSM